MQDDHVAVKRDRRHREGRHVHGHDDHQVDDLTRQLTEVPLGGHLAIDRERYVDERDDDVGGGQVDDEDVRHCPQTVVLGDDVAHHAVADERECEDEAVRDGDGDELGGGVSSMVDEVVSCNRYVAVAAMFQDCPQQLCRLVGSPVGGVGRCQASQFLDNRHIIARRVWLFPRVVLLVLRSAACTSRHCVHL